MDSGRTNLPARVGAPGFGLLMVGLAAGGRPESAAVAVAAALIAVAAGTVLRPAATIAVLLAAVTVVTSNPPPACVALSGLCATAYLVCRHAVGTPSR